jgi:hypothetical protein
MKREELESATERMAKSTIFIAVTMAVMRKIKGVRLRIEWKCLRT